MQSTFGRSPNLSRCQFKIQISSLTNRWISKLFEISLSTYMFLYGKFTMNSQNESKSAQKVYLVIELNDEYGHRFISSLSSSSFPSSVARNFNRNRTNWVALTSNTSNKVIECFFMPTNSIAVILFFFYRSFIINRIVMKRIDYYRQIW